MYNYNSILHVLAIMTIVIDNILRVDIMGGFLTFAHVKLSSKFAGIKLFPAFRNFAGNYVSVNLNRGYTDHADDILALLSKSQRTLHPPSTIGIIFSFLL